MKDYIKKSDIANFLDAMRPEPWYYSNEDDYLIVKKFYNELIEELFIQHRIIVPDNEQGEN